MKLIPLVFLSLLSTIAVCQYLPQTEQQPKWGTLFYPYYVQEINNPTPHEYTYSRVDYFPDPQTISIGNKTVTILPDKSALYITVYANPSGNPVTLEKERVYLAPANDLILSFLASSAVEKLWASQKSSWGRFIDDHVPGSDKIPEPELLFKSRDQYRRAYFRLVLPGSLEAKERALLKETGNPITSAMIKNERPYTSDNMAALFQEPHMKEISDKIIELYELIRPVDLYNLAKIVNREKGNHFTTEMNVVRLFVKF